jgi:hypothetical protein
LSRVWRNWQTRQTKDLVGVEPVMVRIHLPA